MPNQESNFSSGIGSGSAGISTSHGRGLDAFIKVKQEQRAAVKTRVERHVGTGKPTPRRIVLTTTATRPTDGRARYRTEKKSRRDTVDVAYRATFSTRRGGTGQPRVGVSISWSGLRKTSENTHQSRPRRDTAAAGGHGCHASSPRSVENGLRGGFFLRKRGSWRTSFPSVGEQRWFGNRSGESGPASNTRDHLSDCTHCPGAAGPAHGRLGLPTTGRVCWASGHNYI